MLDHAGDAPLPHRRPLEAPDVGGDEPGGELGVLPERPGDPGPARLGGEVRYRVEGRPDPHRPVLGGGDPPELLDETGITGGGEPERLRPRGEARHAEARRRVVAGGVAGIGGDGDGDPEPGPLGDELEAVVPAGDDRRRSGLEDVEVGEVVDGDELGRPRPGEDRRGLRRPAAPGQRDHRLEHEADLLRHRHEREEVLDPLLRGPAGILVRVEHPVLVEVAVPVPVDNERRGRRSEPALRPPGTVADVDGGAGGGGDGSRRADRPGGAGGAGVAGEPDEAGDGVAEGHARIVSGCSTS